VLHHSREPHSYLKPTVVIIAVGSKEEEFVWTKASWLQNVECRLHFVFGVGGVNHARADFELFQATNCNSALIDGHVV